MIVTGGAGFIGSNFILYMMQEHPSDQIVCLDSLTYAGNLENLKDVMQNPNFRFVKESITDREAVYRLFEEEKPDVLVNFAAESHVDRAIDNPGIFVETNVLGTQVLLDAMALSAFIRFLPMRFMEISRWIVLIYFSQKIRLCTLQALIQHQRLELIFWLALTIGHLDFRLRSVAALTIMVHINSRKN